ncbi:MAG: M28 family metallopeptidase [Gammaproteobacteria bacterium]
MAEQLERDHDAGRLKRPVVVALFGGEEMGLCGSRQFAAVLESRHPPLARPLNAVNVDGVGSGGDTVYLIGRSYYSALLPPFQKALAGSGLTLGRDIDRFAYPEGSDHWPLHRAGIPAVSVFSADYRAMNTPRDTLDKVDVAHLRKLARVVYRMVRELAGKK